ncbi:LysR family transcriptional regulator [Pseudomonadota bacterium]
MKSNFPSIPSIKTIEVFESVARLGSLSVAANELCVSTSAISLQIKKLESELGRNLFHKEGRGITLTKEGKELYLEVRDILSDLNSRFLAIQSNMSAQELTVQSYVMASIKWLNMRLLDYQEFGSDGSVKLKIITPDEHHFNSQAADMAFILEREPQSLDPDFSWNKIFPHEITPFCTPELLRNNGLAKSLAAEDIDKLPIICTTTDYEDWRRWFAAFCPSLSFDPYLTIGDKMTAIELALNHKGIVLMSSPFVYREIMREELCRPFDCTLHIGEWGVVYKKGGDKESLIKDVIRHISGE